ncbi:Zinc finger CCCH domain-containing protein 44 [Platanthera guangdongensis]|uniref:Zinc finger CCCH domain-containing protein 44 n=1 Tax=Platanthera guangdongensis TaxID=2320717 RepID=A0ABR2MNJ4_9ASPA
MLRVFRVTRPLMAASKAAAAPASEVSSKLKGIQKPLPLSPALRKFLGQPEISRSGAVKKIWEYIKLRELQNPSNKREIICDEKLKTIFDGKEKVGMLEVAKLLSPHFVKPN